MKRTETAGNPIKDNPRLKDPKFQTFTKITHMQDEENAFQRKISLLREKQLFLEREIEGKQKLIDEKRRDIIRKRREAKEPKPNQGRGDEDTARGQEQQERSTTIKAHDGESIRRELKNQDAKLESLSSKGNELEASKRRLKKQIDSLRREKMLFDEILTNLRHELKEVVDRASNAYEAQKQALDSLHSEMRTLTETKRAQVKEQKRFGKEFQTVYKLFESQNMKYKLHEKFPHKKDESDMLQEEDVKQNRKVSTFGQVEISDSPSSTKKRKQQAEKEKRKVESNFNEKNLNELKQDVERYDNTFKQLMEETKTTQMNEILQTFDQYEEENYAIFKYINELSDELEHLQRIKRKLEIEKKDLELRPMRRKEDPKVKKQEELTLEIIELKKKREKCDQNHKRLQKIMVSLKVSIPIMFERIGCNQEEYMGYLGENFQFKDIDEDGIIKLLGVIERRTNDILQMQNDAQETKHGLLSQQPNLLEPKNGKVLEDSYMVHANENNKKAMQDVMFGTFSQFENRFDEFIQGKVEYKEGRQWMKYDEFRNQAQQECNKLVGKKSRK